MAESDRGWLRVVIAPEPVVAGAVLALALVATGLMLQPIGNTLFRGLFLIFSCLAWAGLLFVVRRRRALRIFLRGGTCLALVILCLPGRAFDRDTLRRAYLDRLEAYTGTGYVWGGENANGIDCSGLVRGSMRDVCLMQGLAHFNPALLREGLSMWWYDCTAKALGEGYRGQTRPVTRAPSINALTYELVRPGDIAVTENGVHTLGYLGDGIWTQADPGLFIVRQSLVPEDSFWFRDSPVIICRWTLLEDS